MTERTFNPKMHALHKTKSVVIEMGEDNYLRMSSEVARIFAGRILQAANEAEGNDPAHMFVLKVEA